MHWILRRIFDRLFVKSTIQAASELEAQMCLELGQAQAQLLRKAHELEQEKVPGFEDIAAGLRAQATRIGSADDAPAMDVLAVVAVLRGENLRNAAEDSRAARGKQANMPASQPALPAPGAKKRGRPRKHAVEKPASSMAGDDIQQS